jgi:hypothetical protein
MPGREELSFLPPAFPDTDGHPHILLSEEPPAHAIRHTLYRTVGHGTEHGGEGQGKAFWAGRATVAGVALAPFWDSWDDWDGIGNTAPV